jgi:hypothetical protein
LPRLIDQPSADRVGMNVVDGGQDGLFFIQIAVVAWTLLPESEGHFPRTLADRESVPQRGGMN